MGRWGQGFWDSDATDQARSVWQKAMTAGKSKSEARDLVVLDAGYRMKNPVYASLVRRALRKLDAED